MPAAYSHGSRVFESTNDASAVNAVNQVGICTGLTVQWILRVKENPGNIAATKPGVVEGQQAQAVFNEKKQVGAFDQMALNQVFYAHYDMFREPAKEGSGTPAQASVHPARLAFAMDMAQLFWGGSAEYHGLANGKLWLQRAMLFSEG